MSDDELDDTFTQVEDRLDFLRNLNSKWYDGNGKLLSCKAVFEKQTMIGVEVKYNKDK